MRAFGVLSGSASSSTTSLVFIRWSTLLTIWPAVSFPEPTRDVEVLGLLEPGLADHLREHRRARELAVGQVLGLQRLLERVAALLLGVLPLSRENHCRILLRARDEAARAIQSRDGPRPFFEVRISTKSPLCSR